MSQLLPAWLWPRAAYVHVPFCRHHCGYCDFAVVAGREDLVEPYLHALGRELAGLDQPQPVDTLFLGGGTPTHLEPPALRDLLALLNHWLPLAADGEFTVEANPATLTPDKIAVLADAGVNRVSLGAQSFQPDALRLLERDHGGDDIRLAVDRVRQRIANVSLDLIFGVPGQALHAWRADLAAALHLGIGHLSTYGLTYETGTRLWKDRQRGAVAALDEDAELAMYQEAMQRLEEAGLEQYEISSFARPGQRCRHNGVYWANHAYWGFGLGAARYVHGERAVNTRDLPTYIRKASAGLSTARQRETLPPVERARETLAVNLRRREGCIRADFLAQTGFELNALAGPTIARHAELGLLADSGEAVALTPRGRCVADAVIAALLVD